MDFYHGSTKAGLTELQPFDSPYSNINEPLVYLTTSKQLALHYIWDNEKLEIKMPMLDIRKDGVLVFQEMFSGALEYFYKGLSGYIYHCVLIHHQTPDLYSIKRNFLNIGKKL